MLPHNGRPRLMLGRIGKCPTNRSHSKDPTTLTRWTKGVLYAEIALSVVAIASDVMEQALSSPWRAEPMPARNPR